ncbi:phosphatase domain-containing protein [Fulvimarina sp. 2208YS6-2-32]|uniref:Phosphatase domain-containing protein n=1 Tax=Fulvimarina uroteuthidis TaxID=3098149 RepID=A0ABU5I3G8_9HYPH|nr:phosphatase domain-containing protein [Fulvimarina sp. 2208YS6-2-32]MDY8109924.1 phosphatase domain-containing protein [Fulvimarina sp. 2208YS6-2-32]
MVETRFRQAVHWVERHWDRTRFEIKRRTGLLGTPILLPFIGMAGADGMWMRGRVIEQNGAISAPPTHSLFENIKLTFKRYETDEINDAQIFWSIGARSGEARTDREGYFDIELAVDPGTLDAPWDYVRIELGEVPGYGSSRREIGAELPVRSISDAARYGVISDIDDTIVKTGAFNFLKHWRTVVANSAETRTAFPGVSHFYRALANGAMGPETNPFFYVSSSPWNLFDLFDRFLVIHDIPRGPMFLKDFGLDATKWLTGGHDNHKTTMIERVFDAYPHLPFILIGDSGQDDGRIYADVASKHPGRVMQVHIRDVTKGILETHITEGIEQLKAQGITVTLAPTLYEAASAAEAAGLIEARDVRDVQNRIRERERDGKGA